MRYLNSVRTLLPCYFNIHPRVLPSALWSLVIYGSLTTFHIHFSSAFCALCPHYTIFFDVFILIIFGEEYQSLRPSVRGYSSPFNFLSLRFDVLLSTLFSDVLNLGSSLSL